MFHEVLFETLTGRPYWTGRSAVAEFGPPISVRYRTAWSAASDAELLAGPSPRGLAAQVRAGGRVDRPGSVVPAA